MSNKLYLCFSTGNTLLDKIIKFVESATDNSVQAPKPLATHSYLAFISDEHLCIPNTVIEARPPRVRYGNLIEGSLSHDRCYDIPLNPEELITAKSLAISHIGQGYHYTGDIIAAVYCLTRISLIDPEKLEFFCSQLCVDILRQLNFDVLGKLPESSITPVTLELWATNHRTIKRVPRP